MEPTVVGVERGYSQVEDEAGAKPPRRYKDAEWAVVFLLHLLGVIAAAAVYMPELMADMAAALSEESEPRMSSETKSTVNHVMHRCAPFIVMGLSAGLGWALVWVIIIQKFASTLIWVALIAAPVMFGLLTLFLLAMGSAAALGTTFVFLITAVYAGWIIMYQRHRIEFATLTLETVTGVIKRYPGTVATSFLSSVPASVWLFGWLLAVGASANHFIKRGHATTYTDKYGREREGYDISGGGKALLLFLMLSNYWTAQVISNVVHVTVSGVVASWYMATDRLGGSPTVQSLKRAMTTSFGSICLGSLLVALVQLLREMLESSRRQADSAVAMFILCCLSCCMAWIEALVELFNHWAFVYVAIKGLDFKSAARETWQLVKHKGLDALVNMNLTSQASGLGFMVGAALSGGLVALVAHPSMIGGPSKDSTLSEDEVSAFTAGYVGVIVFAVLCAFAFTALVSSTITSGVTTLFVCWAEDPAQLQSTNPELHARFAEITEKFLRDDMGLPPAGPAVAGAYNPAAPQAYASQPPRANAMAHQP